MTTPEGRVKAKVKRALDLVPKCWRFMPVQNGMGTPGLDFQLCVGGWFVCIETKAPGKPLTARQGKTKRDIEAAGGYVFVVSDDDSLEKALAFIGVLAEFHTPGELGHGTGRTAKL